MELRYLGQPFEQDATLADFIADAANGGYSEIKIAVAWAKRSGLSRVWDELTAFRDAGGHLTIVVGVSQGGATVEGLELVMELADDAYVFHDPRRTFHPKVYFASSDGRHSLLVGSSNLTAGGLGWNYESSLWAEWSGNEKSDVVEAVEAWFDRLVTSADACLPLDSVLMSDLLASPDIEITSEQRSVRVKRRKDDAPEDTDSAVATTVGGLFKSIQAGLRKLPGVARRFKATPKASPTPMRAPSTREVPTVAFPTVPRTPSGSVARRWVKKMDNTAAQQVRSSRSNPTGNLRLSQERAPMDHKVYFREEFFQGLPWTPTPGKDTEQEVAVRFNTWIDGEDRGVSELRVSHDPSRIAGQGNVPTVLHWGPELGPVLRATSYVGHFLTLERTEQDEFNLIISEKPRGSHRP